MSARIRRSSTSSPMTCHGPANQMASCTAYCRPLHLPVLHQITLETRLPTHASGLIEGAPALKGCSICPLIRFSSPAGCTIHAIVSFNHSLTRLRDEHEMASPENVNESSPLLLSSSSSISNESSLTSKSILRLDQDAEDPGLPSSANPRSVEYDVLPETSTLGRNISWQSAYILVISRVIGSGIFATPGAIVKSVGSIGLTLSLWIVGAIIAACGLAISLEYGCMLPRSGGEKVYLEFTYRHPKFLASTLVAVQAVLLGFTASNCIVFAQYVLFAFDIQGNDFTRKTLALSLITIITIIHGRWLKLGIRIQNFLGWIKVGLIIFMVISGLFVVLVRPDRDLSDALGKHRVHSAAFGWSEFWEGSNWSWGVISTALFKVFYSYAGLSNVNNVMNEVKDPVRTLKSVSITALVTACIMYLLVNVAYFLVVPLDEIKSSGELIAALFFERTFGAGFGKRFLPLAVASSAAGNVMVVTFALVSGR